MSAIITSNFRLGNNRNFQNSVADNSLYLFIGKSDYWDTTLAGTSDAVIPTPTDTLVDQRKAWNDMIALKQITAANLIGITRRVNWESGTTYTPWDDFDANIRDTDYYVITDEFNVYKCIRAGSGASTVKPTSTAYTPFKLADGYVWKYMYHVDTTYVQFLTTDYMPVKTVDVDPVTGPDADQWDVQVNSVGDAGKIYRIVVTDQGDGYTSATATITGDGSGATATCTVSGGKVIAVDIDISAVNPNSWTTGSGYNTAIVTITGNGTGAKARAVLPPPNGHGTDAFAELSGVYGGLALTLVRTETPEKTFIVDNAFRQIGLIENPFNYGTTTVSTGAVLSALKEMVVTGGTNLVAGTYITGSSSGAKAYIDSWDSALGILKYHQNEKTGFVDFTTEAFTASNGGTGTVASFNNPEVEHFTGKILFLENRAPINRSETQTEDIKVIIEF